jgi:hypothetical protein
MRLSNRPYISLRLVGVADATGANTSTSLLLCTEKIYMMWDRHFATFFCFDNNMKTLSVTDAEI